MRRNPENRTNTVSITMRITDYTINASGTKRIMEMLPALMLNVNVFHVLHVRRVL